MGQGGDLTLLIAIRTTLPNAKSLHDMGVLEQSAVDITRVMMADFYSICGGTFLDTTYVSATDDETSEHNPLAEDFNAHLMIPLDIHVQLLTQSTMP